MKSVGFGPSRALIVTGDREDEPANYPGRNDTASDDDKAPSPVEEEYDDQPALTVVESWAESCADLRQAPPFNKRQDPGNQIAHIQLPSARTTTTEFKDRTNDHSPQAENVPWRPDHTAVGYFRDTNIPIHGINYEEPAFEKIPAMTFNSSPPGSLISEHFYHSGNSQIQQTPDALHPSTGMITITGFRPNLDDSEVRQPDNRDTLSLDN